MSNEVQASPGKDPESVDSIPIEESYLDIPDTENEAILDARKTTVITVISAIVFIAVVFLFIL